MSRELFIILGVSAVVGIPCVIVAGWSAIQSILAGWKCREESER